MAFDRGGRRLAASGDRDVTIWEGIPLDAEVADLRQAASLVGYLFSQSPTPKAVSARVRDEAISDAVRQRALSLVEPFWRSQVRQEAERKVRSLFIKPLFRHEVLASLRGSCLERARAARSPGPGRAIRGIPDDPQPGQPGRRRSAGRGPVAYRLALKRAEIACRHMPFEGSYHTTLGMAQYRLGKLQEALTTLTRANELNQAARGVPIPADLAFLAMTRYQIGESDRRR